jgi:hypothetical protein
MNSEWNPLEPEAPTLTAVTAFGVELHVGDRVRIWPQKSADILDLALKGKVAVIEAIERDFEDRVHLGVVLEDDPGRDFGMMRQPGHRFFFSPHEVEPLEDARAADSRTDAAPSKHEPPETNDAG